MGSLERLRANDTIVSRLHLSHWQFELEIF